MWHKQRKFVVADVASAEELLDKFKGEVGTWCLCNGWRCQGCLWLNDSLSENGAQEYAVVREADMTQVESVTVSWMSREELGQFLRSLASQENPLILEVVTNTIESGEEHRRSRCPLCA